MKREKSSSPICQLSFLHDQNSHILTTWHFISISSFQHPQFPQLTSNNPIVSYNWRWLALYYTTKYSALLQQVPQTGKVVLNFIKPLQSHRQSPLHILSDNTTQHYQGKESHFYASFFLDIPLFSCSNEVTMSSPFYSSPDYSKTYKTHKPDLWVQIYKTCI